MVQKLKAKVRHLLFKNRSCVQVELRKGITLISGLRKDASSVTSITVIQGDDPHLAVQQTHGVAQYIVVPSLP